MFLRQLTVLVPVLLVAACQGIFVPPTIKPYRIDVQQGNVVTQEMVAKLQPGMTRNQVRFVLGTPLAADIFHPDRWDYVYRYEKGGKLIEHRRIFVVFSGDKLVRIEGDVVPAVAATGKPAVSAPSQAAKPAAAPAETPAAAPAETK